MVQWGTLSSRQKKNAKKREKKETAKLEAEVKAGDRCRGMETHTLAEKEAMQTAEATARRFSEDKKKKLEEATEEKALADVQ